MKISPSIMCADLLNVGEAVRGIERGGAESIHVDIMDGRFVPGFTFGADFVRKLVANTSLPLDVHLMSEVPTAHVDQFLSLGIDSLTIHVEAPGDIAAILQHIRRKGCRCGVALSPETPIGLVERFLPQIQIALIMTVAPGSVGHPQSSRCVEKAGALVRYLQGAGYSEIEVVADGGVKPDNIGRLVAGGIQRAVSGTGVFRPDMSPEAALNLFAQRIAEASRHARADQGSAAASPSERSEKQAAASALN
jgi:ribulose-phosphate 3-epimerase